MARTDPAWTAAAASAQSRRRISALGRSRLALHPGGTRFCSTSPSASATSWQLRCSGRPWSSFLPESAGRVEVDLAGNEQQPLSPMADQQKTTPARHTRMNPEEEDEGTYASISPEATNLVCMCYLKWLWSDF